MAEHTGGEYPPDTTEPMEIGNGPRGNTVRQAALRRRRSVVQLKKSDTKPAKVASRLLMLEKQRRALELRKGGATYAQIAEAVGYADAGGARKALIRALEDVMQEPADELRTLQVERLNHMLLTLWPSVQAGNERSIETALRVMERLDRLNGTEAPSQTDVNIHHEGAVLIVDGDKDAFIRHMQTMAGEQGSIEASSVVVPPSATEETVAAPAGVFLPPSDTVVPTQGPPPPIYEPDQEEHRTTAQESPSHPRYNFGMDPE